MRKSKSIGQLALALSRLQGEIQNLHKDKAGYGYKYVELSSVLDEARPLLAKHELAVVQLCCNVIEDYTIKPELAGVTTVLMHSSGEWISSALFMPVTPGKGMNLAQAAGSVITYVRRYTLAAILGIAQTDNDASDNEVAKPVKALSNSVDSEIYIKLLHLISEKNLEDKIDMWCKHFNVPMLANLTNEQMKQIVTKIEEN